MEKLEHFLKWGGMKKRHPLFDNRSDCFVYQHF